MLVYCSRQVDENFFFSTLLDLVYAGNLLVYDSSNKN